MRNSWPDDPRWNSSVDDEIQVIEQHVHLQDERHHAETEKKWNQMLPEDVGTKDTHVAAAYPIGRPGCVHNSRPCRTLRSPHR
jgi:hypothetical protein